MKVNGLGLTALWCMLLAACGNPDRVSVITANACLKTLDAGYEQVAVARAQYETLMDEADRQLDAGKIDEFAYDATMDELKYVLDGIIFAGFVKAVRSQQVSDGVSHEVAGIRQNAGNPNWCAASAQFAAARLGVETFGAKAQAIAETAREERTKAQQADLKALDTGG